MNPPNGPLVAQQLVAQQMGVVVALTNKQVFCFQGAILHLHMQPGSCSRQFQLLPTTTCVMPTRWQQTWLNFWRLLHQICALYSYTAANRFQRRRHHTYQVLFELCLLIWHQPPSRRSQLLCVSPVMTCRRC